MSGISCSTGRSDRLRSASFHAICFVGELPAELAQPGILQAVGQLGSRKAAHAEILDGKEVVLANELRGELVEVVMPVVRDASIGASQLASRLGPVAALASLGARALYVHAGVAVFVHPGRVVG
jgi:hypothetical protein